MPHIRAVIIGADTGVGREVARLAVAYGAEVVGVQTTVSPPGSEPWTAGVTWCSTMDALPGSGAQAMIVVDEPDPSRWIEIARDLAIGRIVVVGDHLFLRAGSARGIVRARPGEVRMGPLDPEEPTAGGDWIRVERLAMALLRAALEDDVPSELDHAALCRIGDAVFWQ